MGKTINKIISRKKMILLEESIAFLSNYKLPKNEIHCVGDDLTKIDYYRTELLEELGNINKRREEIINQLTDPNA